MHDYFYERGFTIYRVRELKKLPSDCLYWVIYMLKIFGCFVADENYLDVSGIQK